MRKHYWSATIASCFPRCCVACGKAPGPGSGPVSHHSCSLNFCCLTLHWAMHELCDLRWVSKLLNLSELIWKHVQHWLPPAAAVNSPILPSRALNTHYPPEKLEMKPKMDRASTSSPARGGTFWPTPQGCCKDRLSSYKRAVRTISKCWLLSWLLSSPLLLVVIIEICYN